MVTASFWVCQRHLYTIPAALQTVCKVLQCFQRKALQVLLHRFKVLLAPSRALVSPFQPINTHAHMRLPFSSALHRLRADGIKYLSLCPLPAPFLLYLVFPGCVLRRILTKCSQCGSCKTRTSNFTTVFSLQRTSCFIIIYCIHFEDVLMSYKKRF